MAAYFTTTRIHISFLVGSKKHFYVEQAFGFYSEILGETIEVPEAFQTDLASIPRIVHSLVTVNNESKAPAILHDYLCERRDDVPQKVQDQIFLEAMDAIKARKTLGWVMYAGIRSYQGPKELLGKLTNSIKNLFKRGK